MFSRSLRSLTAPILLGWAVGVLVSGACTSETPASPTGGGVTDVDAGCLACSVPADGGWVDHVAPFAFSAGTGCFATTATPLCAVCLGDGPYPDAGLAPGSHCIVGPDLHAYYLVTQPLTWTAAPGWFVSDTLVGFPHVGTGTPTLEQKAACDAMKAVLPKVPPPDAGEPFPAVGVPQACPPG